MQIWFLVSWHYMSERTYSSNKPFKDGRRRKEGKRRATHSVRQDMFGDLGAETDLKIEFSAQAIKLRS